MELIFEIVLIFGLGLLGLAILVWSCISARSASAVMLWGIVASVLMGIECLLLLWLAGIGSATSGRQEGYRMVAIASAIFALSLIVYFPVALALLKSRK